MSSRTSTMPRSMPRICEQGRLGLPDRDYYLKDDAHFQTVRSAYRDHIAKLLTLAGEPAPEKSADDIIALETALARLQWTRVENRDPIKTYNKTEIAGLPALVAPQDCRLIWPPPASAPRSPPSSWRSRAISTASAPSCATCRSRPGRHCSPIICSVPMRPIFPRRLSPRILPSSSIPCAACRKCRRAGSGRSSTVDRLIGFDLGKLYVERYFPPANKARAEAMIAHLMAAYREGIATLDWMGPDTRREALAKLEAIAPRIAYPATWRDYGELDRQGGDLVGNVMRARRFDYEFWMAKLGRKVDRAEWRTTPQTVNAFYSAGRNEIVFPAGILQPPFFDAEADDAANYGGIGSVIGHEISHAFDDQGSRFDGEGNLRNWWTGGRSLPASRARRKSLVAQYDAFTPLPGYHVNGALTLGENAADNAGLAIAVRAYRLSRKGCPAPVIDGFGGEQRLFISFAQIWHDKVRDAARIERLKVDPHSPGQFRANGTLRNQSAFDDAFDVKPGDAMYLPPEQRISLWQTDREIVCPGQGAIVRAQAIIQRNCLKNAQILPAPKPLQCGYRLIAALTRRSRHFFRGYQRVRSALSLLFKPRSCLRR